MQVLERYSDGLGTTVAEKLAKKVKKRRQSSKSDKSDKVDQSSNDGQENGTPPPS